MWLESQVGNNNHFHHIYSTLIIFISKTLIIFISKTLKALLWWQPQRHCFQTHEIHCRTGCTGNWTLWMQTHQKRSLLWQRDLLCTKITVLVTVLVIYYYFIYQILNFFLLNNRNHIIIYWIKYNKINEVLPNFINMVEMRNKYGNNVS